MQSKQSTVSYQCATHVTDTADAQNLVISVFIPSAVCSQQFVKNIVLYFDIKHISSKTIKQCTKHININL